LPSLRRDETKTVHYQSSIIKADMTTFVSFYYSLTAHDNR
jgi:hypothetical protein